MGSSFPAHRDPFNNGDGQDGGMSRTFGMGR